MNVYRLLIVENQSHSFIWDAEGRYVSLALFPFFFYQW